jgi:hypothetical protein
MVTDWRSGCPEWNGESSAAVRAGWDGVTALSRAGGALWEALKRSDDEATTLAVGRALARIGGTAVAAELREWLLARVPAALCPGDLVALLGELPDAQARAAATGIARENFAEKRLAGRWERVLAGLPTPEARAALIEALGHDDETVRWSAIHAMLEAWEEVPVEAALPLRRLLMDEGATGEVQFCAAALLVRMNDPEMGEECAAGLAEALAEAEGTVADSLAEPTIAAGVLARRGDGEPSIAAWRFLLRRLEGGSEAILSLALPPLLAWPSRELVDALVDGCLRRRPRTPSAVTFARSFRELTDPALRDYAWERLRRLLGEGDAAAAGGALVTLAQAAGALGCAAAIPALRRIADGSQDPHLAEATVEALARLGDLDAISLCAEQLLRDTDDASPADHVALAAALGEIVTAEGRAVAGPPLLRALAFPTLARPAAEALTSLHAWQPDWALRLPAPGSVSSQGTALASPGAWSLEPVALALNPEPEPEDDDGWDAFLVPEVEWETDRGDAVESVRYSPAELPEADADATLMAGLPAMPEVAPLVGAAGVVPAPEALPVVLDVLPVAAGRAVVAPEPALPAAGVASARPMLDAALESVAGMVADLERSLVQLPPAYFRYGGEAAALMGKERAVMTLLCEEVQPALDRLDGLGDGPEVRRLAARAYFVKARLHHALTCDAAARCGADALRERQRWDQAKLAEGSYWHALSLADDEDRRGRALFDLGVLLVETGRDEEAATLFEKVAALFGRLKTESPEGRLGLAAARYVERLRGRDEEETLEGDEEASQDQSWAGALHVARKALRAALVSAGGLAACGAIAWYAWTSGPKPAEAVAAAAALKPVVVAQIEVTRWQAKVRTQRTRRAAKVKTARRGERLTAIGREEQWWKVQFANGVTGWIPARFTREIQ